MIIGRGLIVAIFLMLMPASVFAGFFSCKGDIIGDVQRYKVKEGESLIEIARKLGLGYNEIADANRGLDPFVPGTGVSVTIPTAWILPDRPGKDGLVMNLSEMRLYYFFRYKGLPLVATFPTGIGDQGSDTPTGHFKVIEKIGHPTWHVPESIRTKNPNLPAEIAPGPRNPLGSHALRLSSADILIHGTNRPWGIGRRVSHGCIRLYPEDIPQLFRLVPVGMNVSIVRQPVKVGIKKNKVYVEVHKDKRAHSDALVETMRLLKKRHWLRKVNRAKLLQALKEKSGIPVRITD